MRTDTSSSIESRIMATTFVNPKVFTFLWAVTPRMEGPSDFFNRCRIVNFKSSQQPVRRLASLVPQEVDQESPNWNGRKKVHANLRIEISKPDVAVAPFGATLGNVQHPQRHRWSDGQSTRAQQHTYIVKRRMLNHFLGVVVFLHLQENTEDLQAACLHRIQFTPICIEVNRDQSNGNDRKEEAEERLRLVIEQEKMKAVLWAVAHDQIHSPARHVYRTRGEEAGHGADFTGRAEELIPDGRTDNRVRRHVGRSLRRREAWCEGRCLR